MVNCTKCGREVEGVVVYKINGAGPMDPWCKPCIMASPYDNTFLFSLKGKGWPGKEIKEGK